MELREAIAEIEKATVGCYPWTALDIACGDQDKVAHEDHAIATILNAVIDGTLIPADAVFQVKEGYCLQAYIDNEAYEPVEWVDPSEALEIRSADDVRREGYAEGYKDGFKKSGWSEMQRQTALIDTPQPKGGDDE